MQRFFVRSAPHTRLTPDSAACLLERCVMSARAVQATSALIRPATFVAVLKANPSIVEWVKQDDGQHAPHFRTHNGQLWTLDVSEQLYASRQVKTITALGRSMTNA